jgi:hypothetical protein
MEGVSIMAKDTVKEPTVAPAIQDYINAVDTDRKAKGAAQASTKERNTATRGVFLSAGVAFAAVKEWTADDAIRIYYPADKQPTKTTLYNRRNEWNDVRDAFRSNATRAAALWPTQDEAEKAKEKNVTKQMFLDACKMANADPLATPETIVAIVRKGKAKTDPNAGDILAEIEAGIVALNTRFMGDYAPYHEAFNSFRMAYFANHAKGMHLTSDELEAQAEKEAAAATVAPLKVAA